MHVKHLTWMGLLSISALVGCSSTTAPGTASGENLSKPVSKSAATINHWKMNGAMAAKSDGKGWSASFDWTQESADNYTISLFGPLGNGTTIISRKNGMTSFQRGQEKASSGNAEKLLQQKTGVHFPVTHLYYWARCLAAPGSTSTIQHDQNKRNIQIQQAGFTIDCSQYVPVQQVELPGHIKVTGPHVSVKIIIKNWKL